MERPDERDQRIRELEERLALLTQASLRVNESLDFDTVLQGVMDSARSLTGARFGAITLADGSGGLQDFLFSGMTPEDARQYQDLPDGIRFLEYLNAVPHPLRVPDLPAHFRAMGLPEFRPPVAGSGPMSFLLAPILHLGERAGTFYLSEKEGGQEFTPEDEDTLVMFAAQAAMAIANARRHREERRARAGLETLIDTSPVGVAVFDAATGAPTSFNREALRLVDRLRNPDQSPADLLNDVSFQRADGREFSLKEFPLAQFLSHPETVHAEEIVLRVPDGRRVTVLLNATPIMGEDGAVESVVVAMQDLAGVEELERLRAEFLAMVSHELRVPLATIKGSSSTVLESNADLDPAVMRQFFRIIGDQANRMNELVSDLLDVAGIETGTLAVSPEPAEVSVLVDRARNAFGGGGHSLTIDLEPDLPLVLADRRRVVQVLGNLLSNAARHSPEGSVIRVSAAREGVYVAVSVADEERGIPAERMPHLFRKFSGGHSGEQGGDTGLGLAICKGIVEAHGGRIRAESDGAGLGARFTFTLPTVETAASGTASPPSGRSSRRGLRDEEEPVKVLVVDDDPQELRYVRDTLVNAGYAPLVTGDPEEAVRLMNEERPRLALLDLVLPDTNGIELMRALLRIADVPVIFLSAYGRDDTIARAFEEGAVDYVVKPFSPTELAARIGAALRRREVPEPLEPYVLGGLVIDYALRRVSLDGSPVQLTAMEYRMLAELSVNAGRVLTYGHLLERVWREKPDADMSPMRTMVAKLRAKLGEDARNPRYVFTESRVGYWMPEGEGKDVTPKG